MNKLLAVAVPLCTDTVEKLLACMTVTTLKYTMLQFVVVMGLPYKWRTLETLPFVARYSLTIIFIALAA